MKFQQSLISLLLSLVVLISTNSCLKRSFVKGKTELISVTDTMLNDSSIFVGHIFSVDSTTKYPKGHCEVWINSTTYVGTNDSEGYYQIKTFPGTYSIRCQEKGNEWGQ